MRHTGQVLITCCLLITLSLESLASSESQIRSKFLKKKEERKKKAWKKVFSQIFAKNIKRELSINGKERDPLPLTYQSLYYNPEDFPTLFSKIGESESTIQAFESRERLLSKPKRFRYLLRHSIPSFKFNRGARNLIKSYNRYYKRDSNQINSQNFFENPLGQRLMHELKDTLFIVLSGFGSHLIDEAPFQSVLQEINRYYGRNLPNGSRPIYYPLPAENRFQPHELFYNVDQKQIKMDIVYPMGSEWGDTLGPHDMNAEKLNKWISSLPEIYKEKEIVFIGYSKGLTVALELLKKDLDLQKRTRAVFSLSGPQQGSLSLQLILKDLMKVTSTSSNEDLYKLLTDQNLKTFLADLKINYESKNQNEYHKLLEVLYKIEMGHLPETLFDKVSSFLSEDSLSIFKGAIEQSPTYRAKWNLENLNDSVFKFPLTIFSTSFITNVKDFFHKFDSSSNTYKFNNEIVPKIQPDLFKKVNIEWSSYDFGNDLVKNINQFVDWKRFSMDSFLLHLTSLAAFERSPYGMMDTQVTWPDSKSFFLDPRPLKAQFTENEISRIYDKLNLNWDKPHFDEFNNAPRNKLIPEEFRKNLKFIDLGEVRGSHWSIPFTQAIRIPNSHPTLSFKNQFPRKEFLLSIIQTYALYKKENN